MIDLEQGLEIANAALLNQVGRLLTLVKLVNLERAWQGKPYEQIADASSDLFCYLKQHVGSKLWQMPTNPNFLIGASQNETFHLGNVKTGECWQVLRPDRLYEGINITGVTRLTEAQKAVLKSLEAIED